MSDTLEKALEVLCEKIEGGIEGVAKFEIEDEGAIMIDSNGARLGNDSADVTLSATLDTFRGMLEGDMNPTAAYMSGKLKIDGDLGMAMRLAQIFT